MFIFDKSLFMVEGLSLHIPSSLTGILHLIFDKDLLNRQSNEPEIGCFEIPFTFDFSGIAVSYLPDLHSLRKKCFKTNMKQAWSFYIYN